MFVSCGNTGINLYKNSTNFGYLITLVTLVTLNTLGTYYHEIAMIQKSLNGME